MSGQHPGVGRLVFAPKLIETVAEQAFPPLVLVRQKVAVSDVEKLPGIRFVQHPFQFIVPQSLHSRDLAQVSGHMVKLRRIGEPPAGLCEVAGVAGRCAADGGKAGAKVEVSATGG